MNIPNHSLFAFPPAGLVPFPSQLGPQKYTFSNTVQPLWWTFFYFFIQHSYNQWNKIFKNILFSHQIVEKVDFLSFFRAIFRGPERGISELFQKSMKKPCTESMGFKGCICDFVGARAPHHSPAPVSNLTSKVYGKQLRFAGAFKKKNDGWRGKWKKVYFCAP